MNGVFHWQYGRHYNLVSAFNDGLRGEKGSQRHHRGNCEIQKKDNFYEKKFRFKEY